MVASERSAPNVNLADSSHSQVPGTLPRPYATFSAGLNGWRIHAINIWICCSATVL